MHRELTSLERPFAVETPLGLYAFTVLVAGMLGLELAGPLLAWLNSVTGAELPLPPTQFQLFGRTVSWAHGAAVVGGVRVITTSLESLLAGRWGADLALAVAVLAALLLDQPLVAAEVIVIGLIGECLEAFTFGQTQRALSRLVETCPRQARVLRDGVETRVNIDEVRVGDRVLILPGKRVPVDGIVVEGRSAVDQANLTGESVPVERGPGDAVLAGTVNQFGALIVETRAVTTETVMGRVITLTAAALREKSVGQRTADRFARWFLPVVLGLAAATFVFYLVWYRGGSNILQRASYPALAVLVVSCPCALILATPAAVMAALARLAGTGVLVKSGAALEKLASVGVFAFDKTGTLTTGRLQLGALHVVAPELEPRELLRLAASAEQRSEHPVGRLLVAAARDQGLALATLTDFQAHPGAGVAATTSAGQLLVGTPSLLLEQGVAVPERVETLLAELDAQGQSSLLLSRDGVCLGILGYWDTLRPEAAAVIEELRQSGLETFLILSGDRPSVARAIGERVGIAEALGGLLPAAKAARIAAEQERGRAVAMVGDGLNDAPALATARVGLALGGAGSDLAAAAGDVVLMGDPLKPLPLLFRLSRQTVRIIRQNLIWFALIVNAIGIALTAWVVPLAAQDWLERSPILAALYHQVGSLAVLLNSMRLLWFERPATVRLLGGLRAASAGVDAWLMRWEPHELLHALSARWRTTWAVSLLALALGYAATGLTIVPADSLGYVRRCGRWLEGSLGPGLHWRWPWPWERTTLITPERLQSVEVGFRLQSLGDPQTWTSPHVGGLARDRDEALMLTGDGNLVEVQAVVRYRILDPRRYLTIHAEPEAMLRSLAEASLRAALAQRAFEQVLIGGRAELETTLREQLAELADAQGLGLAVHSVAVQDLHPPLEVVSDYYDVTRALSERSRLVTEAWMERERQVAAAVNQRTRAVAEAMGAARAWVSRAAAEQAAFLALVGTQRVGWVAGLVPLGPGVPPLGLLGGLWLADDLHWAATATEFRLTVLAAEQLLAGRPKVVHDPRVGRLQAVPDLLRLRWPAASRDRPPPNPALPIPP